MTPITDEDRMAAIIYDTLSSRQQQILRYASENGGQYHNYALAKVHGVSNSSFIAATARLHEMGLVEYSHTIKGLAEAPRRIYTLTTLGEKIAAARTEVPE